MQKITVADATRDGADHLAARASDEPLVITDEGRPVAVVLSPRYHEELIHTLREATATINAGMIGLLARHRESPTAAGALGAHDRPGGRRAASS